MSTMCLDLLRGFHPSEDADPADGAVLVMAIFDEMESLDAAGVPFTTRSAAAHLQRALAGESMPIGSVTAAGDSWPGDNGGVRVLDTMQARGLGFEAVFLIGFNADLLPRRPHPDPLLDDADRTLLRGRGGRPLPLGSMARDEERLLLAHMLGSAEGRLTLSWQRADESGKARVQSLALREVSRLTFGGTELERIRERAERIPAHPLDLGRRAAGRWGLLPAPEARINAALQLADPGRLRRVLAALPAASAADRPIIEAGLTMLGIIEDFASPDLRFDGFVAAAAPLPAIWSPSRLEQLGNCPQQYFFRHVLQVDEPADPLTDYEVPLADLGRHVHRVLHLVYRELVDGGTLRGGGDVATRAESILDRVWESESSGLAALVGGRYPLLWAEMSRQWRDALRAFLRADVAEVAGDGEITGLEEPIAIPLGVDLRGIEIEMRGRFDRIRRVSANEFLVSDYKTSGKPRSHVDVTAALKGRRLQMPLYVLMAEARQAAAGTPDPAVRAEVLGVGPGYLRDGTTWDEETGRATLEQRTFAPHRGAFAETIAVLVHLAAAGFFPFDDHDPMICGYCPFVRACRRGQAPTATRLAAADAGRDYFRLRNKSTRAPLLPSRPATAGDGRDS